MIHENKWEQKTIGEFISIKRGHDLTHKERKEGNIPVYGAAGHNGYHNKSMTTAPGLVIGRSGGSFGKVHFVDTDYWPHNTALYVTDFKGNDPYFVYYLLKLLDFSALNSGSAQPSLNRNFLYPTKITVPKKSTQFLIGKVLADVDKKIELNNKINAELESMAKLIYDYWFVQFDFPDANGKPYKSSGGKMVYNDALKREIPEGWEIGSLLDIATFTNGIACQKYRPEEGQPSYKVIKIREMSNGGFSEQSELVSQDIPKKVVIQIGDILFSWSATLDVNIWTGGEGALNQHIFKVTSKTYPRTYYYFEVLRYLQYFKMVAQLRKTTMGHMTRDHLKQSRIVIPPATLIDELHEKINPLLDKVVKSNEENIKLGSIRDWLLPMLMNGQVTVK